MAKNQSSENDEAMDAPEMPHSDDGAERVKGGKKKNKLILVGFGSFVVLAAVMVMMSGGGEENVPSPPSKDGGNSPTFIKGSDAEDDGEGGANIDSEGAQEGVRGQGEDAGVGRERAEVLAEIDEREEVLDKIERGETAVMLGDSEVVDEKEEEPEKPAPVFGGVEPREEPEPVANTEPEPAPMTNTPSSIRPTPDIEESPSSAPSQPSSRVDQMALEDELARMKQGSMPNQRITYTSHKKPSSSNNPDRHTMTPELDDDVEENAETSNTGEWMMPGDTTVAYLSNRVSSDQPGGMVRADILSGNLRGARLLGASKVQGNRLLINFDRMVFEDDIYNIRAQAVDPDTMDASVRDGIDRRLFTRYGVPLLMGVASIGIDYQADKANETTIERDPRTGKETEYESGSSDSLGDYVKSEAGDSVKEPLSQIAQGAANTKPEVWANPGAIGILFVQPTPQ